MQSAEKSIYPKIVITEDSNSGNQFFAHICDENEAKCVSASGKSNIINVLTRLSPKDETVVIVDGAAFGPEMNRIMNYINYKKNIKLYAPESFEWILLASHIFDVKELDYILENTSDYVESQRYFSWEQYYTELLLEISHDSYLRYSKSKLNEAYLMGNVKNSILNTIEVIRFEENDTDEENQ